MLQSVGTHILQDGTTMPRISKKEQQRRETHRINLVAWHRFEPLEPRVLLSVAASGPDLSTLTHFQPAQTETIGIPIVIGDGQAARSVTFFEDDGTRATVTYRGGTTNVVFAGTGIPADVPLSGKTYSIPETAEGVRIELLEIHVDPLMANRKRKLTLAGKGGADGLVEVGSVISDGGLSRINGKNVVFTRASISIAGPLRQFKANRLIDVDLTIDNVGSDDTMTNIKFTDAINFTVDSENGVDIKGNIYINDDPDHDGVIAQYIKNIKIKHDAAFALTTTGSDGKGVSLKTAKLGNLLGGTWHATGVGNITALNIQNWSAHLDHVKAINVRQDISNVEINALSISKINATNMTDAELTITMPHSPKAVALKSMNVKQITHNMILRSTSSIGSLRSGVLFDSTVFVGVKDSVAAGNLPLSFEDYLNGVHAGISRITISGVKGENIWMRDSNIAAWTIGAMRYGFAGPNAPDKSVEIAATDIRSIKYRNHSGITSGSVGINEDQISLADDIVIRRIFSPPQFLKLTPNDPTFFDNFGFSIAINGNIAAIGSRFDDDACAFDVGCNSGSAYLYDVTNGRQLHKLTADDGEALDEFGWAVAISDEVVIVTSLRDDDAGDQSGSAYVFNAVTGEQIFKLVPDDANAGDKFGVSVSVGGNRLIVGSIGSDDFCPLDKDCNSGAAYVFDVSTGEEIFKLVPTDVAAGDRFGRSVAIDGDKAIVGSVQNGKPGTESGSAYIFDLNTGEQILKLGANDAGPNDEFGFSVDLSDNLAVVGSHYHGGVGIHRGAAYVFDITTGQQLIKLTPPDDLGRGDKFGQSVAIDGGIVVVGKNQGNDPAAYVFEATTGKHILKLRPDNLFDRIRQFSFSVAIQGDLVMVGSFTDDAGAVYEFRIPNVGATLTHFEDYNDFTADHMTQVAGGWSTSGGEYEVTPLPNTNGISVLNVGHSMPQDLQINVDLSSNPCSGFSNAYVIFNYQDAQNYNFAGGYFGAGQWRIGSVVGGVFSNLVVAPDGGVSPSTTYNVQVVLQGNDVLLYDNATLKASHTFAGPQTAGKVGLGTRNAIGQFDNFTVTDRRRYILDRIAQRDRTVR